MSAAGAKNASKSPQDPKGSQATRPKEDEQTNPYSLLLQDINTALKTHDNKKAIFEAIQAAFKKRQPAILTTTSNIWYRKYEQEADERTKLENKLQKLKQANMILSEKISLEGSLNSRGNPLDKIEDKSLLAELPGRPQQIEQDRPVMQWASSDIDLVPDRFHSNTVHSVGTSPTKFQLKDQVYYQGGGTYALDSPVSKASGRTSPNSIDPRSCPLCKQQLHTVFQDLEDKSSKIITLEELISQMNQKGQTLISQNSHLSAENVRVEKCNKDLQDTLRIMEKQLIRIMQDQTEARNTYMQLIEQKGSEINTLNLKIEMLELRLKMDARQTVGQQSSTQVGTVMERRTSGQTADIQKGRNDAPPIPSTPVKVVQHKPANSEDSSVLLKRLLEENQSLASDNVVLRHSLLSMKYDESQRSKQSLLPILQEVEEDRHRMNEMWTHMSPVSSLHVRPSPYSVDETVHDLKLQLVTHPKRRPAQEFESSVTTVQEEENSQEFDAVDADDQANLECGRQSKRQTESLNPRKKKIGDSESGEVVDPQNHFRSEIRTEKDPNQNGGYLGKHSRLGSNAGRSRRGSRANGIGGQSPDLASARLLKQEKGEGQQPIVDGDPKPPNGNKKKNTKAKPGEAQKGCMCTLI